MTSIIAAIVAIAIVCGVVFAIRRSRIHITGTSGGGNVRPNPDAVEK